jgi:hypothetical protein
MRVTTPRDDNGDASMRSSTPEVRQALVHELVKAGTEVERARKAFAAPYSSHDALTAYHHALGVQQGIGICIDRLDALASSDSEVRSDG